MNSAYSQHDARNAFQRGLEVRREARKVAHRRFQSLIVAMIEDSDIHLRPIVCHCRAFPWPHANQLSTRCHGERR